MWRMSSSYKLSNVMDCDGVDASVAVKCARLEGGRCTGESDLLAIAVDSKAITSLSARNLASAPSWLRPEVLNPSRVPYTSPSRITKGPSTSHDTPKEAQNTSSPVVRIDSSASGTHTWARRSRLTRPTVTRFCQSQCEHAPASPSHSVPIDEWDGMHVARFSAPSFF
jgi:hypothetical protein